MLDEKKLLKERLLKERLLKEKEEALFKKTPIKKSKGWMFKLILILIIIGVIVYLFMNPGTIQNLANRFIGNLLK